MLTAMPVGAWHWPMVALPMTSIWRVAVLPSVTPASFQTTRCTASAARDTT